MNLLILLFIMVLLGVGFWALINRKSKEESNKESNEQLLHRKRRDEIKQELDSFLKNSHFFTPIAQWRNKTIYEYIFNKEGYLYQFEEIMSENNQIAGRDEDQLCFERLNYKRIKNPTEFLEKNAEAKSLILG